MKSLSNLRYEGYTLLLNKPTGDHNVNCTSDVSQEFISYEEQRDQEVEEKICTFMCGKNCTAYDSDGQYQMKNVETEVE